MTAKQQTSLSEAPGKSPWFTEDLGRLPADERIAFALRFIDGMELVEAAAACRVSLSTFKRRMLRAERKFAERARREPALAEWLKGAERWNR